MVTYPATAITSKTGVNYVRAVTEAAGSLFHKIEQENDLGVDALVELVRAGRPLSVQFGVQIRSGPSYYDESSQFCSIPVGSHRAYWERYPLPLLGIVYVQGLDQAYWVDLKGALRANPEGSVIRYEASKANLFDANSFGTTFVPHLLGEVPSIDFATAATLTQSQKIDEAFLGLSVLFRRFPNETATWDLLIDYFVEAPDERIPRSLLYHLAHVPWHGDIVYSGPALTEITRSHARSRFEGFNKREVLKLLRFVDEENGITRGAIGQSVEAIVSALPDADMYLTEIALDSSQVCFIRECAALILAMHGAPNSVALLGTLASQGSWFAGELERVVREFGRAYPYG